MTDVIFKPLSAEIDAPDSAGSASDVNNATLVRVVNVDSAGGDPGSLVTVINQANALIGSLTIASGDQHIINKAKEDKIWAASTAIKLTSITYPK